MIFEKGITVGLAARADEDVLGFAQGILNEAGLQDLEQLRNCGGLPSGRWLVVPCSGGKTEQSLLSLAVLSLSSSVFFERSRPIVATPKRLLRRLTLYRPRAFYGH